MAEIRINKRMPRGCRHNELCGEKGTENGHTRGILSVFDLHEVNTIRRICSFFEHLFIFFQLKKYYKDTSKIPYTQTSLIFLTNFSPITHFSLYFRAIVRLF